MTLQIAGVLGVALGAALVSGTLDVSASPPPVQNDRPTTPPAGEPHTFLRTAAGFSPSDLAALDRGEALAKVLDTDRREVALVGAVRVKATRDRLFDQYRDVSGLRRSQVFLEVGTFGSTPRVEDLRGLTFEDSDLDIIRDCKPGDCGVRLPSEGLARFQRDVDWRAPDSRQQAGSLWRQLLVNYVTGYAAHGDKALAEYQNKEVPLSVAEEFKVLFEETRYFRPAAAEFLGYLEAFPAAHLEGAEDILYWDKKAFGLRPVVTLTHLTLYAPPGIGVPSPAAAPAALIATKQIYATHYFDAALGLTLVFDDHASGFYMLCVDRARTRSLTGFIRGFVRGIVQRRCRDAMEKILRTTKLTLER
jgi:hypothetical protein